MLFSTTWDHYYVTISFSVHFFYAGWFEHWRPQAGPVQFSLCQPKSRYLQDLLQSMLNAAVQVIYWHHMTPLMTDPSASVVALVTCPLSISNSGGYVFRRTTVCMLQYQHILQTACRRWACIVVYALLTPLHCLCHRLVSHLYVDCTFPVAALWAWNNLSPQTSYQYTTLIPAGNPILFLPSLIWLRDILLLSQLMLL